MRRVHWSVVWMWALALTCWAERVVLTDGKVVVGTIVAENEQKLTIQVSETIFVDVLCSQVASVTPDESRRVPSQPGTRSPDGAWKRSGGRRPGVCFLQVEGPIESDLVVAAVRRSAAKAKALKADVVVVEIDTSGGRLDLAQEVCAEIERLAPAQVVAYVNGGVSGGAFSAGAMLALACNRVYMAPGTAIGAAAPLVIVLDAARRPVPVMDKAVSAISARMRSLAEKNGYPPELAAAMVDPEVELREAKVDGRQTFLSVQKAQGVQPGGNVVLGEWLKPKGKLLTLTALEARQLGLAAGVVASREELLADLGLAGAQATDLQTAQGLAEAVERRQNYLVRLEGQIAAQAARARALDPASFRYKRLTKRTGFRNPGDFEDEGHLWRQRSLACIKAVDACLAAARQKLVLARRFPEMNIETKSVELLMQQLLTLRERAASDMGANGSER